MTCLSHPPKFLSDNLLKGSKSFTKLQMPNWLSWAISKDLNSAYSVDLESKVFTGGLGFIRH